MVRSESSQVLLGYVNTHMHVLYLPQNVCEEKHLQDQERVGEALPQGGSPHHSSALIKYAPKKRMKFTSNQIHTVVIFLSEGGKNRNEIHFIPLQLINKSYLILYLPRL